MRFTGAHRIKMVQMWVLSPRFRSTAPVTYNLAMQLIVKYSAEVTIKSRPVRNRICQQLVRNLRVLLKPFDQRCVVTAKWDRLDIEIHPAADDVERCLDRIRQCTGIAYFLEVLEYPLGDMDSIYEAVAREYLPLLAGKSFAVRCRRVGEHSFSSGDIERELGGRLLQNADNAKVRLKTPDIVVRLDIRRDQLFVTRQRIAGAGGFPMGSLDPVLALVSGGFDSTVASYLAMRRGLEVHFLFFSLGGEEHRIAVQEIAAYLWMQYAPAQALKFICVPFEEVVNEIQRSSEIGYTGIILKRMMLRAAQRVAKTQGIKALVTGEAIAQVSSQTMPNLAVIDKASDMLVLRPLAFMDKMDIVDLARKIGTEDFSKYVPEYCGAVSIKPKTRAKLPAVLKQEVNFDDAVLEAAIAAAECVQLKALGEMTQRVPEADEPLVVSELPAHCEVVDIRHPEEQMSRPLRLDNAVISSIPFYELNSRFSSLPAGKTYYLYCEQGLMSRLHASYLCDAGHKNIAVYRPSA